MTSQVITTIEPAVRLDRKEGGSDFETERILLAFKAKAQLQLVWWKGGSSWAGLGSNSYRQGSLVIQSSDPLRRLSETVLQEGGRLSKELLQKHEATVAKAFGVESLPLSPNCTVLIDEKQRDHRQIQAWQRRADRQKHERREKSARAQERKQRRAAVAARIEEWTPVSEEERQWANKKKPASLPEPGVVVEVDIGHNFPVRAYLSANNQWSFLLKDKIRAWRPVK